MLTQSMKKMYKTQPEYMTAIWLQMLSSDSVEGNDLHELFDQTTYVFGRYAAAAGEKNMSSHT
jgi:hypothetical protein